MGDELGKRGILNRDKLGWVGADLEMPLRIQLCAALKNYIVGRWQISHSGFDELRY